MHKRFLAGFFFFALMLLEPLHGQKEGAVWYFGNNAGLDFNLQYPRPLTKGRINTREGVASISDKDGNLLFYTDGQTVYTKNHDIMNNGEGLLGDISSTQSSVVVPRPGSTTQYYIFTVDQAGSPGKPSSGLNYSVVDISLQSGLGSVIQKNTPLDPSHTIQFTEKIAVVKHQDGKSYWILAHEFGTWVFYEYLLNESGVQLYDQIGAGSVHTYDPNDRDNRGATGYLKSSPKGDLIAAAIEGLHFFELFSFNNRTGDIRLIAKLPAGSSQNLFAESGAAYGVEFSPTSNFLYGSTRKGGTLYQWSLASLEPTSIIRSVRILRESNILCGALQLAWNGKIYVSLGGRPYLGVINSPIQEQCNYIEQGATLVDNATGEGGQGYFGLPTFLSDFFKAAEFYFENTCQNDVTRFYLSTKLAIVGLPSWDIYDETGRILVGKAEVDPVTLEGTYRFTQSGKFIVKLKVNQFGGTITQDREITIHQLPDLNFSDTTSLCKGSLAHLDAGDGAFYSWRDNPNLNVERYRDISFPGKYVVRVTHYNGCSNSDSTVIVEKPVPVILDPGILPAACGISNGSITLKMEGEPDEYDYDWTQFPDNHTNKANNLAFGTYEVKITSKITGCSITRSLSISEIGAPDIIIRSSVTGPVCPGSKITLTAQGAPDYLWEGPDRITQPTLEVSPYATTTYRVTGYSINEITKDTCSGIGSFTVEVFSVNRPQLGADREKCEGEIITLDGGGEYRAWNWSNNETTRIITITRNIKDLVLTVTDQNQCQLMDTINVTIKPLPEVDLGDDIVQCQGKPLELFGGTGDSWRWSTQDTTSRIFVTASDTYALTIRKDGCVKTDSISVIIKPLPEVHLGRDTAYCIKDPIRLNGGKGDSYSWSTGETTREIFVNQSGDYTLTITLDGCPNSDTVSLTVNPLPVVDLGRDTVLCKSSPITLTGGTGESYQWNTGASTREIIVSESGQYKLSIITAGCINSDSIQIQANDPGLLMIDSVTTTPVTCPGTRDGSLKIFAKGSGSSYEYSIDNGLNYSVSPIFNGLYGDNQFEIVVREDKACLIRYPREISFPEPDSIRINYHLVSPSCETCPDGEIKLNVSGGSPPYSIKWSTNDTLTYLPNMVMGKYLVWVTDAARCRETALIDLNLDYPPFRIPNAFTPNGDGANENWEIDALKDFPECEVKVFNRAGQLIWWSDTGYTVPWNGVDKEGNVMPVGAYYYLVWLRSDLKPLKGSVSILR